MSYCLHHVPAWVVGHRWAGEAYLCGPNDVHMLGRGGSTAVETPESAPHTSCQIILVQCALGSFGAWQRPASCGWSVTSVPGWLKCRWSWLFLLFLRPESSGTLCMFVATGCTTDWLLPSSRTGRRTPPGAHLWSHQEHAWMSWGVHRGMWRPQKRSTKVVSACELSVCSLINRDCESSYKLYNWNVPSIKPINVLFLFTIIIF